MKAALLAFFTLGMSVAAPPLVFTAPIRGTIDPATAAFLRQSIKQAEDAQAEALVVELDTPGGLLSSARDMAQAIDEAKVPVVVYVTPAGASATSAGALLAMASHVAAMAPGTNLGAAHPVDSSGKDIGGTMGEKVLSDTVAFSRGLAELRGRPTLLAEEIVAKSRSFSAEQALGAKVVEHLAGSREDLMKKLEGTRVKVRDTERVFHTSGAVVKDAKMTAGQWLLHLIANPNLAAILMSLGVLLIYVEVSNPGISVAGFLGAICLLVAFMAFQTLPVREGALALVVLGVALMVVEPFLTSHGAAAGAGILALLLGLLWLVDPNGGDHRIDRSVVLGIGASLGLLVGVITWAAARTKSLSGQALAKMGGGALAGLKGYSGVVEFVAADGLSGQAALRGEVWSFESAARVSVGDKVRVVDVHGMKVRVEKA